MRAHYARARGGEIAPEWIPALDSAGLTDGYPEPGGVASSVAYPRVALIAPLARFLPRAGVSECAKPSTAI